MPFNCLKGVTDHACLTNHPRSGGEKKSYAYEGMVAMLHNNESVEKVRVEAAPMETSRHQLRGEVMRRRG